VAVGDSYLISLFDKLFIYDPATFFLFISLVTKSPDLAQHWQKRKFISRMQPTCSVPWKTNDVRLAIQW
jgi:hypothetical protein